MTLSCGVFGGESKVQCCKEQYCIGTCNVRSMHQDDRLVSVCFQGKPFTITVIQVCAPTTDAEEAEDWNAKVGSQEIPGVICKFGLGVQMKQGKG